MNTPCRKICTLDVERQYCVGCLRTLEEIANWRHYTEEQKTAITERCERELNGTVVESS